MRIVIFSKQAQPYWVTDSRADDIGALAESLANSGATVHLVTPIPPSCEISDPSLARRLAPIRIEGSDIAEWFQFEKTGPHGVHFHLLQPKKSDSEEAVGRDGARAAIALMESMEESPDWLLSFDEDKEVAETLCANSANRTPFLLMVTDRFGSKEGLAKSVELADAIGVCGSWAYRLASMDAVPELTSRLEDGSLVIEKPPRRPTLLAAPAFRTSAKAALQLRLELPISADVPMLLVDDEVLARRPELLRELLLLNLQVVSPRRPENPGVDLSQFKDRFTVSKCPVDELLAAVDGCIVWQDESLVSLALHLGAVPVTTPRAGADLVDIEPNLLSGSGFVAADDSVAGLKVAAERFTAAKGRRSRFDGLVRRLPSFSRSWSDIASHCLQLMGSPAQED